jgi:hypothetical protein
MTREVNVAELAVELFVWLAGIATTAPTLDEVNSW